MTKLQSSLDKSWGQRHRRNNLFDCLHPFPGYQKFEGAKSTYVGARLRQGRNEALANGISNVRKYNWNRAGLFFERNHSWRCAGQEYIWRQTQQFQRIGLQSIRVRARPTIIQPNIYTIGPAKFLK